MAYGKNGSMCWLAGAVRTLQKRVDLLEASTNGAKCKDDDLHDFKQILSDGDGANADFCVPRQKAVHEMDFIDVDLRVYSKDSAEELNNENLTAYNQVETVPSRHVSFAETLEKVEFDLAMHAEPIPVVGYNASASTMAYPAPETTMTLPATTPLVHDASMEENVLNSDDVKLVMLHGNCSRSEAVSELRANNNDLIEAIMQCLEKEETVMQAVNSDIIETSEKRTLRISPVVDTPEIQTLQCTEGLDTAPDLEKAPAERTLGISLADCEGAIEELSKAMAEGFSAALDEVIENFDKSDGISAVIDEYFDEPDKNLWSDEYVCGTWASEKR